MHVDPNLLYTNVIDGHAIAQGRGRKEGGELGAVHARVDDRNNSGVIQLGHGAHLALESLGGRAVLLGVTVPEALEQEERSARARVLAARARHDRALHAGKLEETQAARASLETARGALLDVVAKIQRNAKATANVVYPKDDEGKIEHLKFEGCPAEKEEEQEPLGAIALDSEDSGEPAASQ